MLKRYPSVYPGCACLLLIPIMRRADSTQIKCTFRCRFSMGGWVIEDETRCLLVRALKLMRPFGSGKGDLKKSETLSERHNHCLATDQSQSSTRLSSTLLRLQSSQTSSALVLKFLLCYVRAGWKRVRYWTLCWILSVSCKTTLCQIVRQLWWKGFGGGKLLVGMYDGADGSRIQMWQCLTAADSHTQVSVSLSCKKNTR